MMLFVKANAWLLLQRADSAIHKGAMHGGTNRLPRQATIVTTLIPRGKIKNKSALAALVVMLAFA